MKYTDGMADAQNIENIKKSIADWQSKLDDGSTPISPEIVEEIIAKLKADLAEAEQA
ncbi:MAG: hypothetical protein Q3974_02060 [Rothia sp. (in: high G+C Gram-positive bacteria)]|nr:hypothetical protein [Rothia sp. (in: high G+C Gram-positive bacteria)]